MIKKSSKELKMKKLALALAVAMAIPLSAQAWTPEKDVSVIVAYKAGSGTDEVRKQKRKKILSNRKKFKV